MSRSNDTLRHALAFVWRHGAAAIALVLIVAALLLGYAIGRPAPETAPDDAAATGSDDGGAPQLYTCSMHPSVRLPDPDAKCPICFMDLVPLEKDAGGPNAERRLVLDAEAAARARVETAAVARFFPTADVRLYGRVVEDETTVARLTAYVPGRIERLFADYVGVSVAQGDHLFELFSPDLIAAFAELRESRRSVDELGGGSDLVAGATRDTLVAAREKLRLLGLTDDQVAAAEAGTLDGDRLTVYAPIGGVITHLAAREGDYLDVGEPIATVADLSRLWLDLEAYESQLPLLNVGQRVRFTVEAHPGDVFEGRVSFIEPMVDRTTRTAAVRVAVDNALGRLKPGMFASATARPRIAASGAILTDELAGRWVGPMHPTEVADGPGTCSICGMDLVPAESLGVVGDPSAAEAPLVIPATAVLYTGTRSIAYVEIEEAERPTYEAREIRIGPRAGDVVIVRGGLTEGEHVVVRGAFRIDSAMQIAAKTSMMLPGGSDGATTDGASGDAAADDRADVSASFLHALKPVQSSYLDAAAALARDDLAGFRRAADDVETALGFVEEAGLVGPTLAAWRRAAAGLRIERPVTTIDEARARFEAMSTAAIDLERRFGHVGGATWRLAYCPMAFDGRGASWLQRGETIANPYFGASMLRCGEIRETFPPHGAAEDADANAASHEGHDHE